MSKSNNNGYLIEAVIRKRFRAKSSEVDEIDFCTKRIAYECKSCALLLPDRAKGKKKNYPTTRWGRFVIKMHNHIRLKTTAEKLGLEPYYVFALALGKQTIIKRVPWAIVDKWIDGRRNDEYANIRIRTVFAEEIK